MQGFFELVVTGKVNLINKYKAKVIPSNYNVALDLGNKNDRLTLAEQFYLQQEDEIIAISKKKKLLEVFSDKKKEVADYIKEKKLSTKDRDDMIELVEYYNHLL